MQNNNIVNNVVERLKQQPIGDLITEEDLYDIVNQAIPKVFFEKRQETEGSGYHTRTVEKEPLIFEIMRQVLKSHVEQLVKDWAVENADKILEHWKMVTDQNIVNYVEKIQNEKVNSQVRDMLSKFLDQMNLERAKMGLTHIYL